MLDALAKGVVEALKKDYKKKGRVEGQAGEGWLVLDFGDVVVHLFSPDMREYYDLEELWSDGKVLLKVKKRYHSKALRNLCDELGRGREVYAASRG